MAAAVVVCTFATAEYAGSAEVLRHTALWCCAGRADRVVVYREADLPPECFLPGTRGCGWWAWKPWCILNTLKNHASPGDVVVYCDAGVAVEGSIRSIVQDMDDVLLFRMPGWTVRDFSNGCWTKGDALHLMAATEAEKSAVQVNAAVQAYKHTPGALRFLEEYLRWCGMHEVVDDTNGRYVPNGPGFVDHRHDQSVLSILACRPPPETRLVVARDVTQWSRQDDTAARVVLDHHRKCLRPVRVAVITPTVGGPYLRGCAESVAAQDLPNVHHYVVVDGPEHVPKADEALAPLRRMGHLVHTTVLPHNVGGDGWNGHRVYAAMPWLVDADYVCFLDEDNEFEPDHLRRLVGAVVSQKVSWGFSLRYIIDAEGREVCPDACESLGSITHTVCGPEDRLIDTSCYLLSRDLAREVGPVWNLRARDPSGLEVDRQLVKGLLATVPEHACVRRHSVRYRAGNTAISVRPSFFVEGNKKRGYDFRYKKDVYVFHFSPAATARAIECAVSGGSHALEEWQMAMLGGLVGTHNLLDGYACLGVHVPRGATLLVSMCSPTTVPWDFLKNRTDCRRILYTAESPNIRHASQWDPVLLAAHFDVVLTYFEPLLADPRVRTVWCPHNTHHLDLKRDRAILRTNADQGRSCGMVLERRDLRGTYAIPNMPELTLTCLDPLREEFVKDMDDVTVYGQGWDAAAARNPGIRLGHSLHRSRDPRHSVDILQGHAFALIIENCDAEGYVSEKVYDALIAGCIPLYYGNPTPRLRIPEGAESGVYLDIRPFVNRPNPGAALSAFLKGLSDDAVRAWKQRVLLGREEVLRQVDMFAFADAFRSAAEA